MSESKKRGLSKGGKGLPKSKKTVPEKISAVIEVRSEAEHMTYGVLGALSDKQLQILRAGNCTDPDTGDRYRAFCAILMPECELDEDVLAYYQPHTLKTVELFRDSVICSENEEMMPDDPVYYFAIYID